MRLKDRVAIVTGAARGIGLAISRAFAYEGAHVALCDLRADLLDGALAEIESLAFPEGDLPESRCFPGRSAGVSRGTRDTRNLTFPMDVTRRDQIQDVVDETVRHWGTVDILVNNAGIYEVLPFEQITEAQWDRLLAVNLKGAFLFCQAVVPHMKRQGAGRIVNIASSAGKTGGTLAGAHYSVSKAGLICLTKQLARELGPHRITVNAVAPGRIDTPLIHTVSDEENDAFVQRTPLGRLGRPEDVADAVLFLASAEASFITGEILDVNGGLLID